MYDHQTSYGNSCFYYGELLNRPGWTWDLAVLVLREGSGCSEHFPVSEIHGLILDVGRGRLCFFWFSTGGTRSPIPDRPKPQTPNAEN